MWLQIFDIYLTGVIFHLLTGVFILISGLVAAQSRGREYKNRVIIFVFSYIILSWLFYLLLLVLICFTCYKALRLSES